jgi:replicative DNA helicase
MAQDSSIIKPIPASLDSEQAVLGSILMNRDAIIAVAGWLKSTDFYLEAHAWAYEAMLTCYHQRIPPDTRMVAEELRKSGRFDQIGGMTFLSSLIDAVPTSYHIEFYAKAVESTAVRRRMIGAGGKIAALAYEEDGDLDTTIAHGQQVLTEATRRDAVSGPQQIAGTIDALYEDMSSDAPSGIPTGFRDYDDVTGGLHPGDFVIVAARPSVGKSALAGSLALHLARNDHRVVIYSLEMTRKQWVQRFVSIESGIPLGIIRDRKWRDDDLTRAFESMGRIHQLPILIDETPAMPIQQLKTHTLREISENGPIATVIVDYAQLCESPGDRDRYSVVSTVSRELKALAKAAQCTVVGLAQLNRAVEGRQNKIPILSDLRETGQLEQDADQVVFIHREELYDKDTDKKGIAELHIAKHRNGALGIVPLQFDAATTRFASISYRSVDGY